jgi:hypothetical protein
MKIIKSKLAVIGIVIAFFIAGCIFYFNYGWPWNVYMYSNKFETYLKTKYYKEFIIDEISYDVFHSTYHAYAYEEGNPYLTFYVGQDNRTKEINDGFEYETMKDTAHKEVNKIIGDRMDYNKAFVEIMDMKKKEIEVNVWTYEPVDPEIQTAIKTKIQEKGYVCDQLFFNVENQ